MEAGTLFPTSTRFQKTPQPSNAQYKKIDNTVTNVLFPPSEVMFTNDKHSKNLRPVALDTDLSPSPFLY